MFTCYNCFLSYKSDNFTFLIFHCEGIHSFDQICCIIYSKGGNRKVSWSRMFTVTLILFLVLQVSRGGAAQRNRAARQVPKSLQTE